MKTKSKRDYVPAVIEITHVVLDSGIAAGSATLRPGGPGDPDTPMMNDWTDQGDMGSGTNDFDF